MKIARSAVWKKPRRVLYAIWYYLANFLLWFVDYRLLDARMGDKVDIKFTAPDGTQISKDIIRAIVDIFPTVVAIGLVWQVVRSCNGNLVVHPDTSKVMLMRRKGVVWWQDTSNS